MSIRPAWITFRRLIAGAMLCILPESEQCLGAETGGRDDRENVRVDVTEQRKEVIAESGFRSEQIETARLSVKGRSQYLAGDLTGARATFQQVESRDPESIEARNFLQRIAAESVERGELNREKTRAQLLEEVTKSWQ